ncbi:hypothetical protein [Streptomyces phaeolivaceus]|uniref:hypothetical protein n=1 Tax=Streptomyces phaeolivaceus TaxID=2653200 RepID=UPI00186A3A73|nr:hypothetical protein [Streptomyces phaeolivaceus]
MLSWQHKQRTVSIWTTAGRMKNVAFTGEPGQVAVVAAHRNGESDLLCRDGQWYLLVTWASSTSPPPPAASGTAGAA